MSTTIAAAPNFRETCSLLREAGLDCSDLEPTALATFVGAFDEGRLVSVGGLEIRGPDALVRSVATAPGHLGRGLASSVVEALEELARERGVRVLYLLTETATAFFEGRGFAPIDRARAPAAIAATSQFGRLCPTSAAFLHKRLADR